MLKNDGTAGLALWHAAGKRDCRWQPYGELIERAAKGGGRWLRWRPHPATPSGAWLFPAAAG